MRSIPLFLVAATAVSAFDRALLVSEPQKREVMAAGGWGANAYNGICPSDSTICEIAGCCPNALTCLGTDDPVNVICCPSGSPRPNMSSSLPHIADS